MYKVVAKYWFKHKRRLFSLELSLVLGVSGLMCAIFFSRTATLLKYENLLDSWGAYNFLIPQISQEDYEKYEHFDEFEKIGALGIGGECKGKTNNSFIAGTLDETGRELYHYPCREGDYPQNPDEIVASRKTLEAMGATPEVGTNVELSIYDKNHKQVDKKVFRISGILKTIETERSFQDPDLELSVPEVFFYNEYFQDKNLGTFCLLARERAGYSVDDISDRIIKDGKECFNLPVYYMAQQMMLNVDTYEELSYEGIAHMTESTLKDFDSTILIPLFSIIVAIVVFISVISNLWIVLNERKTQMNLYRCIGLTKKKAETTVLCEVLVIVLAGLGIGVVAGTAFYVLIYAIGTNFLHIELIPVLTVDPLIAKITLNPFVFPVLICGITAICSVILVLINWKDDMLNPSVKHFRHLRISVQTSGNRTIKKIFFSEKSGIICIFLSIFIIMSSAFFSILYFLERTSQEYEIIRASLDEYELGDIDYLAEKDFEISTCAAGQSNRHSGGIPIEKIKQIESMPDVENVNYSIQAKSTKLLLTNSNKKLQQALYDSNLKNNIDNTSGLSELYEKTLQAQGYKKNEELFNIATVGVNRSQLKKLAPFVQTGHIDMAALNEGREILIVTATEDPLPFHVGDKIQMSDVVITEPEIENYDFSSGSVPDNLPPSFTYDYYGEKTDGYALGKRRDYFAIVGAIVNLKEFELSNYYLCDSLVGENNFNFVCGENAFTKWGLPDHNATLLGIKLNSSDENTEFLANWHEILGNCDDLTTVNTYDIQKDMRDSRVSYWGVLALLIILLLLIGESTIINSIHRTIHLKSKNIGIVRCMGLSLQKLRFRIILYFIKGILFISLIAWIPAKCFDFVCVKYRQKYDGIDFDVTGLAKIFPYQYHIFEHHFVPIYLTIILLTSLLVGISVILITNPLKKKSLVDIMQINRY